MSPRRNIKLILAFEGAAYHGWQMQKGRPTVQGLLREAIGRVTGVPVTPMGSGRTDSGTHARGLAANFVTETGIPLPNLVRALNGQLPRDIRILSARTVPPDFHARLSARSKVYRYQIYRGAVMPPHLARDHMHYPYPLDIARMQRAAGFFVGEHDFASFAAAPTKSERETRKRPPDTRRRIFRCELKSRGRHLALTVEGDGFLHHMVRNMVGTLCELGRGRLSFQQFTDLFELRDRTRAGFTAPAHGLILMRVKY